GENSEDCPHPTHAMASEAPTNAAKRPLKPMVVVVVACLGFSSTPPRHLRQEPLRPHPLVLEPPLQSLALCQPACPLLSWPERRSRHWAPSQHSYETHEAVREYKAPFCDP